MYTKIWHKDMSTNHVYDVMFIYGVYSGQKQHIRNFIKVILRRKPLAFNFRAKIL